MYFLDKNNPKNTHCKAKCVF